MIRITDETDALITQIRRTVLRLTLVSHVSAAAPGRSTPSADDELGGRRPPGGMDYLGDREEEYPQKSAPHFQRRLNRLVNSKATHGSAELASLLEDAQNALAAWMRTPLPPGQEPEFGSPQWKRFVAESTEDAGDLARRFFVTRRYINQIRQSYRQAA